MVNRPRAWGTHLQIGLKVHPRCCAPEVGAGDVIKVERPSTAAGASSRAAGDHRQQAGLVGREGRNAGAEGDLAGRGLSNAGLDDVAKIDFLDGGRFHLCLCECVLEGDDAKLRCGERFERTVERANGRARRGDDDDFTRERRLLGALENEKDKAKGRNGPYF